MLDAILIAASATLVCWASLRLLFQKPPPEAISTRRETTFLFSNGVLLDGTPDAYQVLEAAPDGVSELARVQSALAPDFQGLAAAIAAKSTSRLILHSVDGSRQLAIDHLRHALRLTLRSVAPQQSVLSTHHVQAMQDELKLLRANTNLAPYLAWRQNKKGAVTWINRAYLDAVIEVFGEERAGQWPLPSLFQDTGSLTKSTSATPRRLPMLSARETDQRWFECAAEEVGKETLFTATEATATVVAERRLRDFMQTLTETFAQLPIGLAIFDKKRRLALFNPALIDLTELRPDMLTAKPSLAMFLDALREQRMMPEPRDYASWRACLTDLELAAEQGTYEEIWNLSDGQTYRVTGRPHPDGAIALLFEDISSEIALTRQFRSDLTLGQSVLDSLPDAVAVFSASGELTLSNSAYQSLWATEDTGAVDEPAIGNATQNWAAFCVPTPVWGDIRDFVLRRDQRERWEATIQMLDGRSLLCQSSPVQGGATMVTFKIDDALWQDARTNRLSAV